MSSIWALVQLLPQLIGLGKELLRRYELEQTRKIIKKQKEEVRRLREEHESDPLGTTRSFWSSGMQSDKPESPE